MFPIQTALRCILAWVHSLGEDLMQLFQALQMFPEPLGKLLSLIQGGLSIFYLRRYLEQGCTVPLVQFSLKTSQFL